MAFERLRWRLLVTLGLPVAHAGLQACTPTGPANVETPVTTVTVATSERPELRPADEVLPAEGPANRTLQACPKDSVRSWSCGTHLESSQEDTRNEDGCLKDSQGLRRRAQFPTIRVRNHQPFDAAITRHYRKHAETLSPRLAKQRMSHCCYSSCEKIQVSADEKKAISSRRGWKFTRCLPPFDSVSAPAADRSDCGAYVRDDRGNWMSFDPRASKRMKKQAEQFGGVGGVDVCCYSGRRQARIMRGRPIRLSGRAAAPPWQVGSDWLWSEALLQVPGSAPTALPEQGLREALARAWVQDARLEHASVAAFGRLANELLAWGAHPELVAGCLEAARDEIRHAQLAARVAERLGQAPLGPADFALPGALPPRDLETVLWETFVDGCIGELVATACAQQSFQSCQWTDLAAVHATIANDEMRHAELAWRIVSWGVVASASFRRRLARWLSESQLPCPESQLPCPESQLPCPGVDAGEEPGVDASLAAKGATWGLLSRSQELHVEREVIARVVRPTLTSLLAASEKQPAEAALKPPATAARQATT